MYKELKFNDIRRYRFYGNRNYGFTILFVHWRCDDLTINILFSFFTALALFEHVNLVYGTISEFCTTSGCPDMTGPGNR